MPTYDYRCTACSHAFEQFQSMKDKPLRTCPSCGKKSLERLIGTGAAVIFKGGGFYQTDYRSESYKQAAKADAPPQPATAPQTTDTSAAAPAKPADASASSPPAAPAPKATPASTTPTHKTGTSAPAKARKRKD